MAKIEVYAPTVRRKEMEAVISTLAEDRIGPGEGGEPGVQAKLLIQLLKEKLKFDYCIALRSPAAALGIALRALNLDDGAGVAVSALSPRYYDLVIKSLRLKPLYCDLAEGTCCLSAETVKPAIASGARAIVAAHTLGYVPDMPALAELGLPVIEDISCSFGTAPGLPGDAEPSEGPNITAEAPKGPVLGSAGIFTILGLEERDMLTAGGGALLYAKNRRDASVLRGFPVVPELSLPDMNAAMAVVQVREANRNMDKRALLAEGYARACLRTRHSRFVQPAGYSGDYNNYCFALVLETGMKDVEDYGKRKEIAVAPAFENSIARSWASNAEDLEARNNEDYIKACPKAWSLSLRTALLPLYPRLTSAEGERVAKFILTLP
jgi:dTDP-4-amino-4,6-dideoxygalactose transaminase